MATELFLGLPAFCKFLHQKDHFFSFVHSSCFYAKLWAILLRENMYLVGRIHCTTLDEARKTYYRLAMKFHPDNGGDEELFKELANQFHAFNPSQFKYEKQFNDWSSKAYAGWFSHSLLPW